MFIAHGERLRKYAPWILAGVLVLLLPGFILMFSPSGSVKQERSDLPTIAGKPVNLAEFQRERNAVLAEFVIQGNRQPPRTLEFEDQLNIEATQRLMLLRKAKEFGIYVGDEDVVRQIRSQPTFLTEQGQFDPERYGRYTIMLNNYGVSEAQFEEIIRAQITIFRLRELVGSGANVTPTAVKLAYTPMHEQTVINYVEFDASDVKEPIQVLDEDAKIVYEKNQEAFRKPAEVQVRYVYFVVSDSQKSITLGDDEIAEYYERNKSRYVDAEKKPKPLADVKDEVKKDLLALRAERIAGDRATSFAVKLVHEPGSARPDFAKIATEFGVTPRETESFTLKRPVTGVSTGSQFNLAAFALGPEAPFSDPIRGEDGYYVLEYLASKPSVIPPFEEVKAEVIDRLKRQRALDATFKRGRELVTRAKASVAAGKSFAETCATLNLKPKISEPFSFTEGATNLPAASIIKETVLGMATNAVSDFIPTAAGGLFFHLKQRTEPSAENFEKDRPKIEARLLEQQRQALFIDWVNTLMHAENVEYKRKARPAQPELPVEEPVPGQS